MNKFEDVFEYLKKELIAWRPRTEKMNIDEVGFSEDNVREFESSLPPSYVFDFVYIAPPIRNERGVTTGASEVQRSTQTYAIEVYTRRGGSGATMKKATLKALNENVDFISNLFAKHGFIISASAPNLSFTPNDTARQVINITKTFVK